MQIRKFKKNSGQYPLNNSFVLHDYDQRVCKYIKYSK